MPSFETPAAVSAVEPRDDDADGTVLAERRSLEDGVAVRDVDLAAHVLDADIGGDLLDHAGRLGSRPAFEGIALLLLLLDVRLGGGVGLDVGLDFGLDPGLRVVLRLVGRAGLLLAFVDVGHSVSGP